LLLHSMNGFESKIGCKYLTKFSTYWEVWGCGVVFFHWKWLKLRTQK